MPEWIYIQYFPVRGNVAVIFSARLTRSLAQFCTGCSGVAPSHVKQISNSTPVDSYPCLTALLSHARLSNGCSKRCWARNRTV